MYPRPVLVLVVLLVTLVARSSAQVGVATVAGGFDGPALQAIITDARGVAQGEGGRVFFTDWGQNSVRTYFNSTNGSGVFKVETLFGDLSQTTKAGNLTEASVFQPWGIAYDGTKKVVYIAAHGTKELLVLSNFNPLKDTGDVTRVPLPTDFAPTDMDLKTNGNLVIVSNAADSGAKLIEVNATTGVATILAGANLLPGRPEGVAIDHDTGDIYVADTQRHVIRRLPQNGGLPVAVAGFEGSAGFSDGVGGVSLFNQPSGMSLRGTTLYIADRLNHRIRTLDIRTFIVGTLAGDGQNRQVDGLAAQASFAFPRAVQAVAGPVNTAVLSVDANPTLGTGLLRRTTFNSANQTEVTTLAGFTKRFVDGFFTDAKFGAPIDLALDVRGNIIIADDGAIRSFDPRTRITTTIAGTGRADARDGPFAVAQIHEITAMTSGLNDTLWFSDGERLRLLDFAAGNITTISDTFEDVGGMVLDPINNVLYYTERGNRRILAYDVATNSTRFVAGSGNNEDLDGVGEFAAFRDPRGITRSNNTGFLYVADTLSNKIKRVHPITGVVQTVAGTGFVGSEDTDGVSSSFNQPTDVTITNDGEIFVTDQGNHRLRRFNETNVAVTTVTGSIRGVRDGTLAEALFDTPKAILADVSRQGLILYITSVSSRRLRRTVLVDPCTTGLVCGDSNPCTEDRCDSGSAACFSTPLDQVPCDDSNTCTTSDICDDGICVGTPTPDARCFDGSLCTTGDTCNAQGQCIGAPIECIAPNKCILSVCDPVQGCVNSAKVCNDSNLCTTDICNSDVGCEFVPNALVCDSGDMDACTFDRCDNGTCKQGAPNSLNCDDLNPCTVDSCNNVTGCVNDGPLCPLNQIVIPPNCECQCNTSTPCPDPSTSLDVTVCLCVTPNDGAFRRIEVQYFTDNAVITDQSVLRFRNQFADAANLPAERMRVSSESALTASKKKRAILAHIPNRRVLLDVFAANDTFSVDDMLARLELVAHCVGGVINGICQVNETSPLWAVGARVIIFNRIAVPFNPGEQPDRRPSIPSFGPANDPVTFISVSPIRRPDEELPRVQPFQSASNAMVLRVPLLLTAILAALSLAVLLL